MVTLITALQETKAGGGRDDLEEEKSSEAN